MTVSREGRTAERAAIERWENEGGRTLAPEAGISRPLKPARLRTPYGRIA